MFGLKTWNLNNWNKYEKYSFPQKDNHSAGLISVIRGSNTSASTNVLAEFNQDFN